MALGMDDQALLAGQLAFYGPLGQIGDQSRLVLHGHILLAAEAAAHQFILHDHLVGIQTQKDRGLVAGVVGSLVRRVDEYAVPKGHCDGALRLQECVLGPGRLIMFRHFIFGICDHFLRVSAHQVLVAQHVSGGMHQGSALRQGLGRAGHGP